MTTDTAAVVRTWVVALSVAGMLLVWAVLARTPFPASTRDPQVAPAPTASATPAAGTAPPADPRLVALARRERALRARAVAVRARHDARWAAYRRALAAPPVVVSQPSAPTFTTSSSSAPSAPAPATTTRSS